RVIGVMAPGVDGTFFSDVQMWMPYEQARSIVFDERALERDFSFGQIKTLLGIGRVAEGHTAASVAAELRARFAEENFDLGVLPSYGQLDTLPALSRHPKTWRELRRQVQLLLGGSILLML